jgi:hypothetical protein
VNNIVRVGPRVSRSQRCRVGLVVGRASRGDNGARGGRPGQATDHLRRGGAALRRGAPGLPLGTLRRRRLPVGHPARGARARDRLRHGPGHAALRSSGLPYPLRRARGEPGGGRPAQLVPLPAGGGPHRGLRRRPVARRGLQSSDLGHRVPLARPRRRLPEGGPRAPARGGPSPSSGTSTTSATRAGASSRPPRGCTSARHRRS